MENKNCCSPVSNQKYSKTNDSAIAITIPCHYQPFQDFVEIIKAKIIPSRKREFRAEVFEGAHNWQKFYSQYGVNVSGLVPNARGGEPDVCHCWRFVRRADS